MLYIETNLYSSFFFFFAQAFQFTKALPNLICLGKQGKMEKQKQPSERKEYR